SRNFTLVDEVPLVNLRELEVVVKVLHCARRRCRTAEQVRVNRQERTVISRDTAASRRQVVGSSRELTLTAIDADAGIDECVVDGRVDNASVIQAPAATNTVFAITGNVESKSDAWSKVVSVVDLVVGLRQRRIHVDRIRIELVLVTQTEIQSK